MKLLASVSPQHQYAVFSVSHHDFRMAHNLMADGGQPGLQNYAGYSRSNAPMRWIELPNVTFADLQNDYLNENAGKRRYGVHTANEFRVLTTEEEPNVDSMEWKMENYVWGTRGVNGKKPLKYILLKDAETTHLRAILVNCPHVHNTETEKVVLAILASRLQVQQS